MSLLQVRNLSLSYAVDRGTPVPAVRDVSFTVAQGEFIGLVGESGSGKSTLGHALTGLLRPPGRVDHGQIIFDGVDIASLSKERLRAQRCGGFAMVLQSGMNALNPVRRIRDHFLDIFAAHGHVARRERESRARELVAKVELPPTVLDRYPGELSGGMRQRVSIALALSLRPRLVVLDEPTTALDVLVQKAVMETVRELQRSERFTALLISHDLGAVLESASRVLVMHDGEVVEDAAAAEVISAPRADYTRMLLEHYADPRADVVRVPGIAARPPGAAPRNRETPAGRAEAGPVVLTDVVKVYRDRHRRSAARAVDSVTLTLEAASSTALVGASGSGKSTLARLITGIERPTSGSVLFGDRRVDRARGAELRALHGRLQMVFQDPYAALNPVHTVEYTLLRPVLNYSRRSHREARAHVLSLLDRVGLTPVETFAAKLPHQLSGGQRQRVVIARALASDPQMIVADEPVSMLDVSLRAGVLALLESLRQDLGVGLLYITHDLLSARLITDRIVVMSDGSVVEEGDTAEVLQRPRHEYTVRLLDAVPVPGRRGQATGVS